MYDLSTHAGGSAGPGTVLADRYEIVRLIARGGMADVYEGRDRMLERAVAVKVFRAAEATDRRRFDAEVLLLASLNHPGLVAVFDAGEHDGDGFMVLELIEGPTLRDVMADDGPLTQSHVAAIGVVLADALAHVHDRGIVHRDLTPANVLCGTDGVPRLTDFGIARLLDTTRITASTSAIGTVGYMAPEQVEGKDVSATADVYALGLVLLEALTGAPAFTGPSHEVALARLARDPAVPDSLSEPWPELLRAMTARDPADRPSAADVANTLRAAPSPGPARSVAAAAAPLVGSHVPDPSGAGHDPDAPTTVFAAPVDETAAPMAPAGSTTVMPVMMRPDGAPAPGSSAARDVDGASSDRTSGAMAPVSAVASPLAQGAGRSVASVHRSMTPARWAAAAAVVLIGLLWWRTGQSDWREEVLAAQGAAVASAPQSTTTTTVATTTTTTAPAPVAPAVEIEPDDDRDEDADESKGKGKGQDKDDD